METTLRLGGHGMRRTHLGAAGLVVLLTCVSAQAQRVTVDFADVPLRDALAQLERLTGAQIGPAAGDAAAQPVTLRTEDTPLRAVLRAICGQADCYVEQTDPERYQVRTGADPAEACPTAQAGPYRVRIRSITITDALDLKFELGDENPLTFQDRMTVELTVEADLYTDAEAVIGIDQGVRAADDAGRVVAPRATGLRDRYYDPNGHAYARDGVVLDTITLDVPHLEAVGLRLLEGEIVVHDSVEQVAFEFPLRGPLGSQTRPGHTFALTDVEPRDEDGYYCVSSEWRLPRCPRVEPWHEGYLVAADGTRLHSSRSSGTRGSRPDGSFFTDTRKYTLPGGFVPETFLFLFVAKSPETHTVHFRFDDIPLPAREE